LVLQNDQDPALIELIGAAGARPVRGAGTGTEQIESLRVALRSLREDTEAAVVLPVDCPLVKAETVSALIESFRRTRAPIVRPTYKGRHGHPVLFSAALFTEFLDHDLPEGARSVVHRHEAEVGEIEVDYGGVLADIDTPEEYMEQFGERP
jgi:CTP:molybdopterin cytidylyltransferase MocA